MIPWTKTCIGGRSPRRDDTSVQGTTHSHRPAGLTPNGVSCRSCRRAVRPRTNLPKGGIACRTGALCSLLLAVEQCCLCFINALNDDTSHHDATMVPPSETYAVPTDPFILLLRRIHVPTPGGAAVPDLGLTDVKWNPIRLDDGSYSRTPIYLRNSQCRQRKSKRHRLGAAFSGTLLDQINIAYELPGGAIVQRFLSGGFLSFSGGGRGTDPEGSFDLAITDAAGIYKDIKRGHNNMVARLHQLVSSDFTPVPILLRDGGWLAAQIAAHNHDLAAGRALPFMGGL
jgi:hypothetical protein